MGLRAFYEALDNFDPHDMQRKIQYLRRRRNDLIDLIEGLNKDEMSIDPNTAFSLYDAWKAHGVMPLSGGYLEQPAWWVDLIGLMSTLEEAHTIDYDIQDLEKRLK